MQEKDHAAVAQELLAKPLLPGDKMNEALREHGLEPSETAALLYAMLQSAKRGNVSAAKFLAGVAGWSGPEPESEPSLETRKLRPEELEGMSDRRLAALYLKALRVK